ncbi:hypothetical protein [Vibrio coralliilyticus]|uniref:hypothetical protein n=1 Tax=Vibrio coralliilyticus TaxID=190893 RepID=UPI00155F6691|nr:hypothetical protein [Vibrio coralliilyticus]NRF16327.1 hypothetical protein [Vibrio coralliilyticus]
MSFFDDLGNFGSGMLDSVGEGFNNLITNATTPTQTVNPNTQKQVSQEADNHGNAVTTPQSTTSTSVPKWALYGAGALGVTLLGVGLIALANNK